MANPNSRDFIARLDFDALPGSQYKQIFSPHHKHAHSPRVYESRWPPPLKVRDRNFSRVSDAAVMLNLLWMKSLPPSFRNELIAAVDLQKTFERQTPFSKTPHLICPPTLTRGKRLN